MNERTRGLTFRFAWREGTTRKSGVPSSWQTRPDAFETYGLTSGGDAPSSGTRSCVKPGATSRGAGIG
jgi:hypothetical protein